LGITYVLKFLIYVVVFIKLKKDTFYI
jgi:hypothetical protein